MKRLFLDDVRNPGDCVLYMKKNDVYYETDWDIVRNYNDFVKYITENGVPDEISFDHDLADEHYDPSMYVSSEEYGKRYDKFREKTGYDCAKWLTDYCVENVIPLPTCYVHSMNPVGRDNIWSVILSADRVMKRVM
jgi:hypothetical protein